MRRIRSWSVVTLVCWSMAAHAPRIEAQQGSPLPFDPDISVYVAHEGTWINYATMKDEQAEIEDPVAVFAPEEEVSDEIDVWGTHQINLPAPPPGWTFFKPTEGEPMHLHVAVQDTQNRLCEVIVKEWGTGTVIATLPAGPGGGEVAGSIPVEPTTKAFQLEAKAGAGTTLFFAGANNPTVDDVVAISVLTHWEPNRGVEHNPCPIEVGPDYGHPRQVEGKPVRLGAWPQTGCGPRDFENDTAQTVQRFALYQDLRQAQIVRDDAVGWQVDAHGLGPDALTQVTALITAARQPYQNKPQAFQAITILPFSRGTAHWPMTVSGNVHSLLYFPYRGKKKWKAELIPAISTKAELALPAAEGKPTATTAIVAEIKVSLTRDERTQWHVLDPEGVGDIWGLNVNAEGAPSAEPDENITAAVTFELFGDITAPDGQPGPLSGQGTATLVEARTNPAPPTPEFPLVALLFPADGQVAVQLGKGWKWTAAASPDAPPYGEGKLAAPDPFPVPILDGARRFTSNLGVLLTLTIKTVANGQPEEADVELERKQGDAWAPAGSGRTSLVNGEQVWEEVCLQPGTYHVRARGTAGGPWSGWEEFAVAIGVLQVRTLTVPPPEEPGGG